MITKEIEHLVSEFTDAINDMLISGEFDLKADWFSDAHIGEIVEQEFLDPQGYFADSDMAKEDAIIALNLAVKQIFC